TELQRQRACLYRSQVFHVCLGNHHTNEFQDGGIPLHGRFDLSFFFLAQLGDTDSVFFSTSFSSLHFSK
ncbi:hypothetical protein Ddye_016067, partial [Dipteronia dyeriana]